MNIRVSISGPVMGDITISREQDSGRCVTDGPDRDAEDCARMLEQMAAEIRRMFPAEIPTPSRADIERELNEIRRETGGMLGDEGKRIADLIEQGTAGKTDAVFVLGMIHAAHIARRG